jgi:hypothetical protein
MVKFEPTLGGKHYGAILKLPVEGLHVKHAVQRGNSGYQLSICSRIEENHGEP